MKRLLMLLVLLGLTGCMKVSDMADGTLYQLRDAGVLDHAHIQRNSTWRLQADSLIYIAQGHFVPPGHATPANVVAEQAFAGFVEYFPMVRRAPAPQGLEEAMQVARGQGAHYLLYLRFASADDRIGTYDEWADQEALDRLGVDKGVIQLMLLETNTRYLLDYARIRQRGGFLTFYDKKPQDLIGPPLREYAQRLIGLSH